MNLFDHDFLKEKKKWPGLLSLSRWHGNQAFDQGQKKSRDRRRIVFKLRYQYGSKSRSPASPFVYHARERASAEKPQVNYFQKTAIGEAGEV